MSIYDIEVKDIDSDITIVGVVKNSPAKKAGILAGDIIVSVNGSEYKANSQQWSHTAGLGFSTTWLGSVSLSLHCRTLPSLEFPTNTR